MNLKLALRRATVAQGGNIMNNNNTEKLFNQFPIIYRERFMPTNQSEMPWGFECGNGWYNIIHSLSSKLEEIASEYENKELAPAVSEVRSGGDKLIFRVRNSNFETDTLVFESMQRCVFTCESCGYAPAFLQDNHVVKNRVMCNKCYKNEERRRRPGGRPTGKTNNVTRKA